MAAHHNVISTGTGTGGTLAHTSAYQGPDCVGCRRDRDRGQPLVGEAHRANSNGNRVQSMSVLSGQTT